MRKKSSRKSRMLRRTQRSHQRDPHTDRFSLTTGQVKHLNSWLPNRNVNPPQLLSTKYCQRPKILRVGENVSTEEQVDGKGNTQIKQWSERDSFITNTKRPVKAEAENPELVGSILPYLCTSDRLCNLSMNTNK